MVGRPIIRAVNKIGDIEVKVSTVHQINCLVIFVGVTMKVKYDSCPVFIFLGFTCRCKCLLVLLNVFDCCVTTNTLLKLISVLYQPYRC